MLLHPVERNRESYSSAPTHRPTHTECSAGGKVTSRWRRLQCKTKSNSPPFIFSRHCFLFIEVRQGGVRLGNGGERVWDSAHAHSPRVLVGRSPPRSGGSHPSGPKLEPSSRTPSPNSSGFFFFPSFSRCQTERVTRAIPSPLLRPRRLTVVAALVLAQCTVQYTTTSLLLPPISPSPPPPATFPLLFAQQRGNPPPIRLFADLTPKEEKRGWCAIRHSGGAPLPPSGPPPSSSSFPADRNVTGKWRWKKRGRIWRKKHFFLSTLVPSPPRVRTDTYVHNAHRLKSGGEESFCSADLPFSSRTLLTPALKVKRPSQQ